MVKSIESKAEWDELLSSGQPFVVDFWATWCGPCKLIGPHFEKLEPKYPQIKFVKVDVDEQAEIAQEVGVRAMPTFVAYNKGAKAGDLTGAVPAKLIALIDELSKAL